MFEVQSYDDSVVFVCAFCGEGNETDVDVSGGRQQIYVEDCQVCCRPNLLRVVFDETGRAEDWAESESWRFY